MLKGKSFANWMEFTTYNPLLILYLKAPFFPEKPEAFAAD
jgi:hypothetical protein